MQAARKLEPPRIEATPTPAAPANTGPPCGTPGTYDYARVRIAPGRLIPGTRYRVTRWLGEGGMGVVYEAQHVDIEQRVAVKILRRRFCDDPAAVGLFRQEARATGQLGSDNIVQVRDFAELPDGRLMLAMEFLEGQDLQALIDGPIDPARVIAILRQCCRGLAVAHDHGLIHRDIKPENIFLTAHEGRPDKVKLLDFGISMFVDGETSNRLVGGTPGFLAPEAILHGRVGPAIDQFALGCVGYAMLTGQPAFAGETVAELIRACVNAPPRPPSELREGIPPALETAIMRCLAADPSARFPNMRAVEAQLCRAQIEAGLQTAWDDLPLPEVEAETRAWLLEHMPEAGTGMLRSRQRRGMVVALATALGLGAIAASLTVSAITPDASVHLPGIVEQKVDAARAAAAKALYVYPPPTAPGTRTAYRIVRELEAIGGPDDDNARKQAAGLREEFAETLTRLGDRYWSADGGKLFAIAYYEQAVLFEPSAEPAATRSTLSAQRIDALSARAATSEFSRAELETAEPLVILATEDASSRREQIRAYRKRRQARLAKMDEQLDELARVAPSRSPAARREPSSQRQSATQTSAAKVPAEPDARSEVAVDPPALRSKEGAKAAATAGTAALRAGNEARAKVLLEKALGLNPGNTKALAGLRDLHFDRGDYSRAVRYGKRAVRSAPRRPTHRIRLGDAYFKAARYDLALKQYQEASHLGAPEASSRLRRTKERLP